MLSKNEFRLLHLLPIESAEGIQSLITCYTEVVPLSAVTNYETLSYVWGEQRDTVSINVDRNQISITKSLEAALKRLRLRDKSRCLWIDQLCINQKDDDEKSNQVPLMGHIYSNSTRCIIWIGEIESNIKLSDAQSIMDIIRFMAEYGKSQGSKPHTPMGLKSEDALFGPMQALDSISLGKNPWWERIWTLQEAVLPSQSCMLWGPLTIPWETFAAAGSTYPVPPVDDIVEPYRDIVDRFFSQVAGLELTKTEKDSPLHVIFRWSFRKATNPLDKVYGLLGLFPLGTLSRVESCNYHLGPASVYAMATADLIENDRSLHPIALRCLRGSRQNTPDIPGWALDLGLSDHLSLGTIDGEDASWSMMHNYHPFNACNHTSIDWKRFEFNATKNSLTLTGFKVDRIALRCPEAQINAPDSNEIPYSELMNKVSLWYTMAEAFHTNQQKTRTFENEVHWSTSFWIALLGGFKLDPEYVPERRATSEDVELAKDFIHSGKKNSSCYSIFATMCHRTMYLTETGFVGVGPPHLDKGDEVWVLDGGKVPFVLRPAPNSSPEDFVFIGSSYCDRIMDGEAADSRKLTSIIMLR